MGTIEVVCPAGHRLKVRDDYAGKTGSCPVCGAKVKVPPKPQPLSDDDILQILGDSPASPPQPPVNAQAPPIVRTDGPTRLPKKICEKCHREIIAATRICPYCHTYLGFSDVR